MSINLTLVGQAITFSLFVWFTMKYVWPLIMDIMVERESKIADGLAAAERGHYELEKANKKAKEIISTAVNKAGEIIDKANHRANLIIESSDKEAKEKYNQIVSSSEVEIKQQSLKIKEELKKEVANIAIMSAEKIIKNKIDHASQDKLISDFVSNL